MLEMFSPRHLLALSLLVASVTCQCSKQETNTASKEFKDCVDNKEKSLLHKDSQEQEFICSVLEELKVECSRVLARCRSREYVDDKVALHIDSISGIFSTELFQNYSSSLRVNKEKFGNNKFWENVSHSESL